MVLSSGRPTVSLSHAVLSRSALLRLLRIEQGTPHGVALLRVLSRSALLRLLRIEQAKVICVHLRRRGLAALAELEHVARRCT